MYRAYTTYSKYKYKNCSKNGKSEYCYGVFRKENGTVLIMTAILLPLFFMLIGMITDIGNAFVCRAELNKACMAAAEEAAKQIDMGAAQDEGLNNLGDDFSDTVSFYFNSNIIPKQSLFVEDLRCEVTGGSQNPRYIEVYCSARVQCFFLKFIGINDIAVHTKALGRLKGFKPSV
ncbi:MAG: hypothetical protein FJW61_06300 [Actinobacteria bacterium]|nr:hypothetical protein [Actinomycetota bacterium]